MSKKKIKKTKSIPHQSAISRIAQKAKLSIEDTQGMVVKEHELNNWISKKKLVKIEVELDEKTRKRIKEISDILKVSIDAVMCYLLERESTRVVSLHESKRLT